jgi:polyvinyl alcohol dehydrogenase (cytochrome)
VRFATQYLVLILFILSFLQTSFADSIDEAAEPEEGEIIFQANCAYCHDRTLPRIPTRADLQKKEARDIYAAITAGVMAPYARSLSHPERRLVSEYAAGNSLGDFASGAAAIPKSAYCTQQPAEPLADLESGWNSWGNNLANTRYQPAAKAGLNKENINQLKLKWAFGVPAVSTMSGHPIVADGRLFFGTFSGLVVALNAESGCALWVFEVDAGVRSALTLGKLADGSARLYFGDLGGKVYAIDPNTGIEVWSMLADEHPHTRITGTPVYHNNRLYVPLSSLEEVAGAMPDYECCSFRGGILSLDAGTGSQVWKTFTIKEAPTKRGKNAVGTQLWAPSGAAVWTAPTLEPSTNTVYIVTGDSYSDPAAPESDAVMALAMDTGEVKWTTQTLAGDAFTIACNDTSPESFVGCPESNGPDLDFGSSPVLVGREDSSRILLAGQKSGILYALNPDNGEIIWSTEVGDGGIVGGIEWGFAVDQHKAYVAIAEAWEKGAGEAGGISAVNLKDGSLAWEVEPHQGTCENRKSCNTGQLAAVTLIDGVVFSGSLDGHLRAYDTDNGAVLWDVDTYGEYEGVNGVKAHGGSINAAGPAIVNGHVYVNSGYGMWNLWMPGNALLTFSIDGK